MTNSSTNTIARTLHDAGLATWFGGSLMGAVGLNGAAAQAQQPTERLRIATLGWRRWAPLNVAAVASNLAGGAMLTAGNKSRIATQKGVGTTSVVKTALTGAALAANGLSGYYHLKLSKAGDSPVEGATEPNPATDSSVASAQKALRWLQWTIPATTGALMWITSVMGEQQRPTQVASGLVGRLIPD